eukprot:m51a1_g8324 putative serine-threonine protein (675) ;mRNA; f:140169-148317
MILKVYEPEGSARTVEFGEGATFADLSAICAAHFRRGGQLFLYAENTSGDATFELAPIDRVVSEVLARWVQAMPNNKVVFTATVFDVSKLDPKTFKQPYASRLGKEHSKGMERTVSTIMTALKLFKSKSTDNAALEDSAIVAVSELLLKVEGKLVFTGNDGHQIPIGEEITQKLTLTNEAAKPVQFRVEATQSHQYDRTVSPREGTVSPGKSVEVEVSLTVLCTCKTALAVTLHTWSHGERRVNATLCAPIESALSPRIDKDEVAHDDSLMGSGPSSLVYRGAWRGNVVALKFYGGKVDADEFAREVAQLEGFRHQRIPTFYGAVHTPGCLATLTELCPEGNVEAVLARRPGLSALWRLRAVHDVCQAMDFLHQSGVLSGNLKPQNVLVASLFDSAAVVCKVADFGCTRQTNDGSIVYKSPEVLMERRPYSRGIDVYSFAFVVYLVFAGAAPFLNDPCANSPSSLVAALGTGKRPAVPENWPQFLRELLWASWDDNPSARPSFADLNLSLASAASKLAETLDPNPFSYPVAQPAPASCPSAAAVPAAVPATPAAVPPAAAPVAALQPGPQAKPMNRSAAAVVGVTRASFVPPPKPLPAAPAAPPRPINRATVFAPAAPLPKAPAPAPLPKAPTPTAAEPPLPQPGEQDEPPVPVPLPLPPSSASSSTSPDSARG